MDEIRLKKLHLNVRDLSPWESFFSDVLDLILAPTADGLLVKVQDMEIHLKLGASASIEWEFSLSETEKKAILSRWSFLQYRADNSIQMNTLDDCLSFQIDPDSCVKVYFDALHICESFNPDQTAVRNF